MNSFKKRQIVIFSIIGVVALLILLPSFFGGDSCDGLFGFISFSHEVKLGNSSFAISADGTVESATFEIAGGKGFNGVGFGSNIFDKGIGGSLFTTSRSATYQLVYEKGMEEPEEKDSATSSFSRLIVLEDVELAAEALLQRFPGQAMTANFSSSSSATHSEVLLTGYDGYFRFDLSNGELEALQPDSSYPVGDKLTVNVDGKVYMIVF